MFLSTGCIIYAVSTLYNVVTIYTTYTTTTQQQHHQQQQQQQQHQPILACTHAYKFKELHAYISTYVHTHIHTYICPPGAGASASAGAGRRCGDYFGACRVSLIHLALHLGTLRGCIAVFTIGPTCRLCAFGRFRFRKRPLPWRPDPPESVDSKVALAAATATE